MPGGDDANAVRLPEAVAVVLKAWQAYRAAHKTGHFDMVAGGYSRRCGRNGDGVPAWLVGLVLARYCPPTESWLSGKPICFSGSLFTA